MSRLVLVLLLVSALPSFAGSAKDALLEIALSDDPTAFERHLPEALQTALRKTSPNQREHFLEQINPRKLITREGGKIRTADNDPESLVIEEKTGRFIVFTAEEEISDGTNAIVVIRACESNDHCDRIFSSLRLEGGEWRILEFAPARGPRLDDPKFIDELAQSESKANELTAVGTLRTYNTAILSYEVSFPKVGVPHTLGELGGNGSSNAQPSADAALMVDPSIGCAQEPCIKSGYEFRYTRLSPTSYTISGRPVQFGTTGTRSFYTDESGVIRATTENREATVKDAPL